MLGSMLVTFGIPIYVQYLIYTPKYLIFTPISFLHLLLCWQHKCLGPIDFLWSVFKDIARAMKNREGGGRGHAGRKKFCTGVHVKLLWRAIYCANTRNDYVSQSGSRSCRGLGMRSPRIMQEYDLTKAIAILLLTQPRTCEKGSSSFFAMS